MALVVALQCFYKSRLRCQHTNVFKMAISKRSSWECVASLSHHVKTVCPSESHRFPTKVDCRNIVSVGLGLNPNGLTISIQSKGQSSSQHLWVVSSINTKTQTMTSILIARINPGFCSQFYFLYFNRNFRFLVL